MFSRIINGEGFIEQAPNWDGTRSSADIHANACRGPRGQRCQLFSAVLPFGGAVRALSIVVGQGLGAGLVAGTLIQGAENAAGEIGHVTAMDNRDLPNSDLGAPQTRAGAPDARPS